MVRSARPWEASGVNSGSVAEDAATGAVSTTTGIAGGLAGTILNTYASGSVSDPGNVAGELVGTPPV